MSADTPAARGYRMPAEWASHAGTWFSWPHSQPTWPDKLTEAEAVLADAVAALSAGETVHVNVLDERHREHVAKRLAAARGDVRLHLVPTNDAWCRDHGAIFVTRQPGEGNDDGAPLAAVSWGFNAWGGKYPPFDLDDAVAGRMAEILGVPCFDGGMILEGGSIEVDGEGALLATESCLLTPTRNPAMAREQIETRLQDMLGVERVVWLPGGDLVGDDTDGHVDNIARFARAHCVIASVQWNRGDPAQRAARPRADRAACARSRRARGAPAAGELCQLLHGQRGRPVAGYGEPGDRIAANILADALPSREIVTIDCRDLIIGLGSFHCLSQQVPGR